MVTRLRLPCSNNSLVLKLQPAFLTAIPRTRHAVFGAALTSRPGLVAFDFALAALEAAGGTDGHDCDLVGWGLWKARSNYHVGS